MPETDPRRLAREVARLHKLRQTDLTHARRIALQVRAALERGHADAAKVLTESLIEECDEALRTGEAIREVATRRATEMRATRGKDDRPLESDGFESEAEAPETLDLPKPIN